MRRQRIELTIKLSWQKIWSIFSFVDPRLFHLAEFKTRHANYCSYGSVFSIDKTGLLAERVSARTTPRPYLARMKTVTAEAHRAIRLDLHYKLFEVEVKQSLSLQAVCSSRPEVVTYIPSDPSLATSCNRSGRQSVSA